MRTHVLLSELFYSGKEDFLELVVYKDDEDRNNVLGHYGVIVIEYDRSPNAKNKQFKVRVAFDLTGLTPSAGSNYLMIGPRDGDIPFPEDMESNA